MSFYDIGKEVQLIKSRLDELEQKLGVCKDCFTNFEAIVKSGEVEKQLVAGIEVSSITFNWGRTRVSQCEWREGYLTIFSDGR
jgi:hypothetical protein